MKILKSRNFYWKKARIDKKNNQEAAYNIQVYLNNTVDKMIISNAEGFKERPQENVIASDLAILNKPAVYSNYQRLLNSPYIDNNAINSLIVKNRADSNLNRIVEVELERMTKNLDFIESRLNRYDVPVDEYKKAINEKKNPETANRRKILDEVQKQKEVASAQFGVNIPDYSFTYRNIDILAESLLRESQMTAQYEKAILANEIAEANGLPPVYTKKKWIWVGDGKTTRHESTNMQERDLEDTFTVINDATLEVDEMLYPKDPNGSPSNSYICYCEFECYGPEGDYLGGVDDLTPVGVNEEISSPILMTNIQENEPLPITSYKDLSNDDYDIIECEGVVYKSELKVEGVYKEFEMHYTMGERELALMNAQKSLNLTQGEMSAVTDNMSWDCRHISASERYTTPEELYNYYYAEVSEGMIYWNPDVTDYEINNKVLEMMDKYIRINENLHNAINKTEEIGEGLITYKGARMPEELAPGYIGTFEGFASTSFVEDVAWMYTTFGSPYSTGENKRITFKILIPPEAHALALNTVGQWYTAPEMKEIHELLLDKNMRYECIDYNEEDEIAIVRLLIGD